MCGEERRVQSTEDGPPWDQILIWRTNNSHGKKKASLRGFEIRDLKPYSCQAGLEWATLLPCSHENP